MIGGKMLGFLSPKKTQAVEAPSAETLPQKKKLDPNALFGKLFKNDEDTGSQLATSLLGQAAEIDEVYYPPEIVGGVCPHIKGEEEMLAWQAAAEASDSERLHIVYSVSNDRVWYLAVKSIDLASHAKSWCPFAAFLPGLPQAQPAPVCYLYTSLESASLLSVGPDSIQIHRGTTSIIQAKAERVARELGNAPVIQLLPEKVDQLTPIPWRSRSLLEDRARRFLTTVSIATGLALAVVAFCVWILAAFALSVHKQQVQVAHEQASAAVSQLMTQAMDLKNNPTRGQIAQFVEVNDSLVEIGGWLKKYEITGARYKWEAVVPLGVTSEKISSLGAKTAEVLPEGYKIIGEGR